MEGVIHRLLLWTTAAYAPERPDSQEKEALSTFFENFQDRCVEGPYAQVYAKALRDGNRPRVGSRRELMTWLFRGLNYPPRNIPTWRNTYMQFFLPGDQKSSEGVEPFLT